MANYIQGCKKTLGWLAGVVALSSVICTVLSLCLWQATSDGEKPEQGAAFCFSHIHHSRTLSYYRPIQENSENSSKALSYIRPLMSSTALHDLKETQGHRWTGGERMGGQDNGTFQQAHVASWMLGCRCMCILEGGKGEYVTPYERITWQSLGKMIDKKVEGESVFIFS